jgi:hypothetical protein
LRDSALGQVTAAEGGDEGIVDSDALDALAHGNLVREIRLGGNEERC